MFLVKNSVFPSRSLALLAGFFLSADVVPSSARPRIGEMAASASSSPAASGPDSGAQSGYPLVPGRLYSRIRPDREAVAFSDPTARTVVGKVPRSQRVRLYDRQETRRGSLSRTWYRIRFPDGRPGWIVQEDTVGLLGNREGEDRHPGRQDPEEERRAVEAPPPVRMEQDKKPERQASPVVIASGPRAGSHEVQGGVAPVLSKAGRSSASRRSEIVPVGAASPPENEDLEFTILMVWGALVFLTPLVVVPNRAYFGKFPILRSGTQTTEDLALATLLTSACSPFSRKRMSGSINTPGRAASRMRHPRRRSRIWWRR